MTWATTHRDAEDERGLRLCGALPWYWHARVQVGEARRMVEAALAGTSSQTLGRARALFAAGWSAIRQNDFQAAQARLEESATIFRAWGLAGRAGLGDTLVAQGIAALTHYDYTLSLRYFEESLALRRALDYDWGIAQSLNDLASVAMNRGDYASARPLLEEGLSAARSAGDKGLIGLLHSSFVELLAHAGDAAAARPHLIEGLIFLRELEDYWRVAGLLTALGELEAQTGQTHRLERAVRLWASADAILAAHGDYALPTPSLERAIAAERAELGDAAFAVAWDEGSALTMHDAIDYALTELEFSTPIEPAAPAVTNLRAAKLKFGGLTAANATSPRLSRRANRTVTLPGP